MPVSSDRSVTLKAAFDALQSGRFEDARAHLRPFVPAARPKEHQDLEVMLLLGLALAGCGDADAAAPLLTAVATVRPAAMHPCLDLVALLQRQYRVPTAEPVFLACLALTPGDARLQLGHAQLLYELFRFDEAFAAVEESLRLQPGSYPALNQRAIILVALGRIEEALTLFRRIVAEDPGNAPAWANLGCTLAIVGGFEEGLSAYRRSIQIKPSEPQVRLNHSICLLKAGRMVQGWQEHEWRFRLPGHTRLPLDRILPTIGPNTDLAGQRILLTHEEGIGDTLMFLRYVPLLARRGAIVTAWVPGNLARLVARVEGIAGVDASPAVNFTADWHCPFISLPRAFTATPDAWGIAPPYLNTDPDGVAAASRHLADAMREAGGAREADERGRLRVGLVWGGAPRPENLPAHAIDRKRSMSLSHLAPLGALRGISLVSLQHGPYAQELNDPPDGLALWDPMRFVHDMDDTASLVRNLDVVVSVDTSIAHLAGGLGVPTILLDRYDNCWRWFHGRTDSPWYPAMRIVRQPRPGDWTDVIDRVMPMLQQMADSRQMPPRAGA